MHDALPTGTPTACQRMVYARHPAPRCAARARRSGLQGFQAAALALLLALPAVAGATVMVPPSPFVPKDFTMVKRNGAYHLFYIRRNPQLPADETEKDFGHAVSWDLANWQHLPAVLPVQPSGWDNLHVWAPHIVESQGVYYMFYTGVTHVPGTYDRHQRIGVATSSDLMQWNRLAAPVYSCGQVSWAACDSMSSATGFRDPFVMPDPGTPGLWRMYYAAHPEEDPEAMLIGLAGSNSMPGGWSDQGRFWETHNSTTFSALTESPHLFEHAGRWFLLFTTNAIEPIGYATSFSPLGGWVYKGSLGSMLGFNTSPWFASEYLRDGTVEYFAAASAQAIEILRIDWKGAETFGVSQPDPFHVTAMTWSAQSVSAGTAVDLQLTSVNGAGRWAFLDLFEIDADGSETAVPAAQIGFPDSIEIAGATTTYVWTASAWNDPGDGPDDAAEYVVRLRDRTAASGVLRVHPATVSVGGGGEEPGPEHVGEGFVLGFSARTPVGPGFTIELPVAGAATLDVFDLQGRRVRRLVRGPAGAGTTVVPWDARGHGGERLGPGLYFARLRWAGQTRTVSVTIGSTGPIGP